MWYRVVGCLVTLTLGLLAALLAATAQSRETIPRVGMLEPESQQRSFCIAAFQQGLRDCCLSNNFSFLRLINFPPVCCRQPVERVSTLWRCIGSAT